MLNRGARRTATRVAGARRRRGTGRTTHTHTHTGGSADARERRETRGRHTTNVRTATGCPESSPAIASSRPMPLPTLSLPTCPPRALVVTSGAPRRRRPTRTPHATRHRCRPSTNGHERHGSPSSTPLSTVPSTTRRHSLAEIASVGAVRVATRPSRRRSFGNATNSFAVVRVDATLHAVQYFHAKAKYNYRFRRTTFLFTQYTIRSTHNDILDRSK